MLADDLGLSEEEVKTTKPQTLEAVPEDAMGLSSGGHGQGMRN